jgi:hypothetical protein
MSSNHHDVSEDARARTIEFLEQLGVDVTVTSGLILHGNGRLVIEQLDGADIVFEPGTYMFSTLPLLLLPIGASPDPLNLALLLRKYIAHVAGCEGTDFTDHRGGGGVEFTDDEWATLQRTAALGFP